MPVRLCAEPGCPERAVYRGRCAEHSRVRERATRRNQHLYGSKRWRVLRRAIIAAHPMCQGCDERTATEVDHIVPLAAGGEPYDPRNLQALCVSCHSQKTRREMRGVAPTTPGEA